MNDEQRQMFDECFDRVLATLPERISALIEHDVVIIVDDEPSESMLAELALEEPGESEPPDAESLLGLHTGVPMTEWSVEDHGRQPTTVHLFRRGLLAVTTVEDVVDVDELRRQIRITLLHEVGHHFGLNEADLDELGYG